MARLGAIALLIGAVASACSPAPTIGPAPLPTPTLAPTAAPTLAPPTLTPTVAPTPIVSAVVGTWTRTIDCESALAAFHALGFEDQIQAWVVGNFVGENATPASGHECDDAKPPEEHSHFFTADGKFGSLDANGEQVDNGAYSLVDATTLAFPTHAAEFGYNGDLPVMFVVSGDQVTFTVVFQDPCEGDCRVAYGWALSAFYGPGAWTHEP